MNSKWFIEEDSSSSLFIDKYVLSICSKLDSELYEGLLRNYNFENIYEKDPLNPFEQKVSSIENSVIYIVFYKYFLLNLEQ